MLLILSRKFNSLKNNVTNCAYKWASPEYISEFINFFDFVYLSSEDDGREFFDLVFDLPFDLESLYHINLISEISNGFNGYSNCNVVRMFTYCTSKWLGKLENLLKESADDYFKDISDDLDILKAFYFYNTECIKFLSVGYINKMSESEIVTENVHELFKSLRGLIYFLIQHQNEFLIDLRKQGDNHIFEAENPLEKKGRDEREITIDEILKYSLYKVTKVLPVLIYQLTLMGKEGFEFITKIISDIFEPLELLTKINESGIFLGREILLYSITKGISMNEKFVPSYDIILPDFTDKYKNYLISHDRLEDLFYIYREFYFLLLRENCNRKSNILKFFGIFKNKKVIITHLNEIFGSNKPKVKIDSEDVEGILELYIKNAGKYRIQKVENIGDVAYLSTDIYKLLEKEYNGDDTILIFYPETRTLLFDDDFVFRKSISCISKYFNPSNQEFIDFVSDTLMTCSVRSYENNFILELKEMISKVESEVDSIIWSEHSMETILKFLVSFFKISGILGKPLISIDLKDIILRTTKISEYLHLSVLISYMVPFNFEKISKNLSTSNINENYFNQKEHYLYRNYDHFKSFIFKELGCNSSAIQSEEYYNDDRLKEILNDLIKMSEAEETVVISLRLIIQICENNPNLFDDLITDEYLKKIFNDACLRMNDVKQKSRVILYWQVLFLKKMLYSGISYSIITEDIEKLPEISKKIIKMIKEVLESGSFSGRIFVAKFLNDSTELSNIVENTSEYDETKEGSMKIFNLFCKTGIFKCAFTLLRNLNEEEEVQKLFEEEFIKLFYPSIIYHLGLIGAHIWGKDPHSYDILYNCYRGFRFDYSPINLYKDVGGCIYDDEGLGLVGLYKWYSVLSNYVIKTPYSNIYNEIFLVYPGFQERATSILSKRFRSDFRNISMKGKEMITSNPKVTNMIMSNKLKGSETAKEKNPSARVEDDLFGQFLRCYSMRKSRPPIVTKIFHLLLLLEKYRNIISEECILNLRSSSVQTLLM